MELFIPLAIGLSSLRYHGSTDDIERQWPVFAITPRSHIPLRLTASLDYLSWWFVSLEQTMKLLDLVSLLTMN